MAGRAGLSLAVLDRLADLLGMKVVTRPKANKGRD
jgi:hypothetical protein